MERLDITAKYELTNFYILKKYLILKIFETNKDDNIPDSKKCYINKS